MRRKSEGHVSNEILELYLDQELGANELSAVGDHLEECALCQARLFELTTLFQAIESVPDSSLDRNLSPVVLSLLQSQKSMPKSLRILALAEVLIAISIVLLIWPLKNSFSQLAAAIRAVEIFSLDNLIFTFSELGDILSRFLQQVPVGIDLPPLLSSLVLPSFAWMAIILCGALVCLGMNGLLLSRTKPWGRQSRRD